MTELSPAAQAVLDAFGTYKLRADHISEDLILALAAALRVAALQLREAYTNETYIEPADDWLDAIATELENAQ